MEQMLIILQHCPEHPKQTIQSWWNARTVVLSILSENIQPLEKRASFAENWTIMRSFVERQSRSHLIPCWLHWRKSSSVLCNANVLKPSLVNITINGVHLSGLLDTGARDCFMTTKLAKRLGLKINKIFDGKVTLTDRELKSNVIWKTRADLVLGNEKFLCKNVEFTLLNNLVKEVIMGLKILKQHQSNTFDFKGNTDRYILNMKMKPICRLCAVMWNSQRCS